MKPIGNMIRSVCAATPVCSPEKISTTLFIPTHAIMGAESRKENLVADSRSSPSARPVEMVAPSKLPYWHGSIFSSHMNLEKSPPGLHTSPGRFIRPVIS
jgi:hypothetical protein